MLITALWLLLILYLARMVMTGGGARALPPDWSQRAEREIARLRAEVDRLSGQVDKLEDEQSFLLRLLAPEARPALGRGPGSAEPARDREQVQPGAEPSDPSPMGDPNGHTRGH